MCELSEGFVYIIAADGTILQRYNYDVVAPNGLPCYLWPEGSKIVDKPTPEQRLRWIQQFYAPVGPVENV